jgi:hypothetical protein
VFYDLVDLAEVQGKGVRDEGGGSVLGVWSDDKFFEIGTVDDE